MKCRESCRELARVAREESGGGEEGDGSKVGQSLNQPEPRRGFARAACHASVQGDHLKS